MPDITMCMNKKCKSKNECYRFLAKPDTYQSYSEFKGSYDEKEGRCKHFWDIKERITE